MGLNVVSLYVVLPAAEVLADGGNPGLAAARSVVPPVRHTDRDVRELGLASHGVHASHTFQDGAETAEAEAGGAHVPALAAGGIVVVDRPGGGVAPHRYGVLRARGLRGVLGRDGAGLLRGRSH